MNNPNPLLPQGTLPPRGRSNLYIKILMIFAVHIVVLGGILMVGCKNTSTAEKPKTDDAAGGPASPMAAPGTDLPAPAPTVSTPGTTPGAPTPPPAGSSVIPSSMPAAPVATVTPPVAPPVVPAATGGSVYVIAHGDLLSTIATKNGVTLKALEDANPGLDPKKLQIGHKLQIPASAAVASADVPKAGADATATASGDATIYIVKSGDVLVRIAKAHNTSVKAIEALNDMKTSSIKAGQKLKVPVMKMASADAAPAPAPATTVPAAASGGTAPTPMVRAN
ncbi:MAG: LysM peptidoglycan-binding domain-containing protein [Verrucomicrobiota bacterium]